MAGSSTYPETVDNKTALQDGIDYMEADNVNNAYTPINKTQTFLGANGKGASWSTDVLEYLGNNKNPVITKTSASALSVCASALFIKNSGQTYRLMRHNTVATAVTASNIDTGSMVIGYYYVYALAETAASTFTIVFSTSASFPSPSGVAATNYELIGWFYNESNGSLDVTSGFVGNLKGVGRIVPNLVQITGATDITTTSAAFVDMTSMLLRIYTNGGLLQLNWSGSIFNNAHAIGYIQFDVDGTPYGKYIYDPTSGTEEIEQMEVSYLLSGLAAGAHTVKAQWKTAGGTTTQYGATHGVRTLRSEEL